MVKGMTEPIRTYDADVLVVGGGIAGLAQTVALAQAGFTVTCIDALPPEPERAPDLDGRTTALLQGAVKALGVCGVWPLCRDDAAALRVMRIVDESGGKGSAPVTATFDAGEVGEGPFGYNVPNASLRRALLARLRELPAATHVAPAKLAEVHFESSRAVAVLGDGRRLAADLVIGADGKNSPSREAAGIRARQWAYGQTAMAFSIGHGLPHDNVSTEFHRPNGPLVLVPLPGRRSSVVWVERERAATAFLDMSDADFRAALVQRIHGVLGEVQAVGPRFSYPVKSLIADRYAAHRLALIGEAAHALPPIGAQGLNLGITDVATLTEALADARREGKDIGAESVLADYTARRRPDVVARVFAVDTLNRAVMTRFPPLQALRHLGLSVVDRIPPLKSGLMRQGMAPLGQMPKMMRGIALEPLTHDPVA